MDRAEDAEPGWKIWRDLQRRVFIATNSRRPFEREGKPGGEPNAYRCGTDREIGAREIEQNDGDGRDGRDQGEDVRRAWWLDVEKTPGEVEQNDPREARVALYRTERSYRLKQKKRAGLLGSNKANH